MKACLGSGGFTHRHPAWRVTGKRTAMSRTGCCIPRIIALGLAVALCAGTTQAQDMGRERQAMVDEVAAMARAFAGGTGKGSIDPRVLAALGRVPRHEFVPAARCASAYENRPLPIGHGQTISQPYIVAADDRRAERRRRRRGARDRHRLGLPGGGAGRARRAASASIEIVEPLGEEAARAAARLGYAKVAAQAATATTAGRSTRRSTRSSSPPPPATCRRRWCSS